MYKKDIGLSTPIALNKKIINSLNENEKDILNMIQAKKMFQVLEKYGQNLKINTTSFDDTCEREVEKEQ